MGNLGISDSFEDWLDEFIMINSGPNSGSGGAESAAGSPITRREYYARFCGPDVDPKKVYQQHLKVTEENRNQGAITETAYMKESA